MTGMLIALVLIAMLVASLGMFIAKLDSKYDMGSNLSFNKYNQTERINTALDELSKTNPSQQAASGFDMIAGYYKAGYQGVVIVGESGGMFVDIMDSAADDVPVFGMFNMYIVAIILIIILVGIILAVLLKMWI